jgi:putative DNA primase/helicase
MTPTATNHSQRRTKADVASATTKPEAIPGQLDGIPAEIRDWPSWIVWRYDRAKDGKWTKVPYRPWGGGRRRADTNSDKGCRNVWADARTAFDFYLGQEFDGFGFVINPERGVFGIDLDNCRDAATGELDPWAREIVDDFRTYTEVSPSGTGIKLLCRAKLPGHQNQKAVGDGKVELFSQRRYFALTGQSVPGTPATIEDRQAALEALHADLFPPEPARPAPEAGNKKHRGNGHAASPDNGPDGDAQFIERMRTKDAKLDSLMRGDTSGHDGDHSRADSALCMKLAFYLQRDANRIDAMFRGSGLMRAKWDERHYADGRTYGAATVGSACEKCSKVYTPHKPKQKKRGKAFRVQADGDGSDGDAGSDGEPSEAQNAYETILCHWRMKYQPVFRQGTTMYSGALGREVRMGEACCGAGIELIAKLAEATNAPSDEEELPSFFRRWAPSAWVDLLAPLRVEEDAAEVSESAEGEFRRKVAAALYSMVTLGQRIETSSGDRAERQERRSLIQWCATLAKGKWADIRSYLIWCMRTPEPERRLRVALRLGLFSQVQGANKLAEMTPKRFAGLAVRYGVALPGDEGPRLVCETGKQGRLLELHPDFVAGLTARPDPLDGSTDRNETRAQACNGDQSVNPSENAKSAHNPRFEADGSADGSKCESVNPSRFEADKADNRDGLADG